MKIPDKISHSNILPLNMLVTSKQEAVLYEARDDDLREVASFAVDREESKRQEEPRTRSRGIVVKSADTYDRTDNEVVNEFMQKMETMAKKHFYRGKLPLYVFTPASVKNRVIQSIARFGKVSPKVIEGNYMHNRPLDLLERIVEIKEIKQFQPATNEEKKILSTGTVSLSFSKSSSRL